MSSGPPSRTSRRGLKTAAWTLGVVGLLVVGAGLGQLAWPARGIQQVVVAPTAAPEAAVSQGRFPHVTGLDENTARSVIATAGFGTASITTSTVPAAGPAGFVVRQEPAPGSEQQSDLTAVSLTLSQPVTTPPLVGLPADEAKRQVLELYGVPQLVRVTTAEQPAGIVLTSEPEAGAAMPVEVVLRVSDGGQALSLLDLQAVSSSRCSKGSELSINGQVQAHGLQCTPGNEDRPAIVEYAIGRRATYLAATVGMLDSAGMAGATLRVLGDGNALATVDVAFGAAQELRVDVTDVLRLRLEVTGAPSSGEAPRLVLGNVRLVGDPAELDQIGS